MTALWGARNASQLDAVEQAFGWKLSSADYAEVDGILAIQLRIRSAPNSWLRLCASRWPPNPQKSRPAAAHAPHRKRRLQPLPLA